MVGEATLKQSLRWPLGDEGGATQGVADGGTEGGGGGRESDGGGGDGDLRTKGVRGGGEEGDGYREGDDTLG